MSEPVSLADKEKFLAVAKHAAIEASKISMKYFSGQLDVEYKGDESPVTIADRETETVLRDVIGSAFPDHGIFGEEHGKENMDADFIWVLDPIDGTKSFITGIPLFGMLISLTYKNYPLLSLIHMPAINETFEGVQGKTSLTHNGLQMKSRACSDLKDAICFVGEADKMFDASKGLYEKLYASTKLARFGYDCYPYAQVASGKIDMVIERNLEPYDFCALVPVVEGAGGVMTDWSGKPLNMGSSGDVIACGDPELHRQALKLISDWR